MTATYTNRETGAEIEVVIIRPASRGTHGEDRYLVRKITAAPYATWIDGAQALTFHP